MTDLRALFNGRVIAPGDARYDPARRVFYGKFDRRPAAIVRVADAGDVCRLVVLAREHDLALAIRGGGHGLAGHSASEGGIVLDLTDLKALEIDPARRTAWAEAGLTAGEYTAAAAAHGLATGFGDTGSVGIGGLTLGGGIGFLVRKHGLTIDDLLAAEVVTADGELRYVDAQTEPDLFWAIRGGGGNFGVVIRFQFRLHPVETVVGGLLMLPATPDTIAGFMAAAEAAPDELSAIANIMPAPPLPFVPEAQHGQLALLGMLCHAGGADAGTRVIAPFRALATPLVDTVRPRPYPEMYTLFGADEPGPPQEAARSLFLDSVPWGAAEIIVEHLKASTTPLAAVQLRALGGAMARVPVEATAFAHRGRRIMAVVIAAYERPEETPAHRAWVSNLAAALRPGDDGVYVNFLGDEGADRVRAAYPGPTWERLRSVKARYDPANLFRFNQNIPPA